MSQPAGRNVNARRNDGASMGQRGTQADYARHRGVDPSRITRLKEQGRVVFSDGLVDFEATDRLLDATLDQTKAHRDRQLDLAAAARDTNAAAPAGAPPAEGAPPAVQLPAAAAPGGASEGATGNAAADYWTHKALREAAEAALSELKLQERLGVLIEAREVRRAIREAYSRAANKLLLMPAQAAPVICSLTDPQQVESLLLERVRQVINELASELDQLAAAATAERSDPPQ